MKVKRFDSNPIIHLSMSPSLGGNVNGPSLIRAPSWLSDPLGKYYLYFAHHAGSFIRLAYSDYLEGPWSIYEPGTLHLSSSPTVTTMSRHRTYTWTMRSGKFACTTTVWWRAPSAEEQSGRIDGRPQL